MSEKDGRDWLLHPEITKKDCIEWLYQSIKPFKKYIESVQKVFTPSGEKYFLYFDLGDDFGSFVTPWFEFSIHVDGLNDFFPWLPFNKEVKKKFFLMDWIRR